MAAAAVSAALPYNHLAGRVRILEKTMKEIAKVPKITEPELFHF